MKRNKSNEFHINLKYAYIYFFKKKEKNISQILRKECIDRGFENHTPVINLFPQF